MSHKPGGGLHSKVVKHSSNPKVEPRAYARNPGAAGQYGQSQGSHVTRGQESNYRGEPDPLTRKGYSSPVGPTSFNNVGVGGGRTIYKTGSQDQHGQVSGTNKPQGRDILSSYGPESSRSRNPGRSDTEADF